MLRSLVLLAAFTLPAFAAKPAPPPDHWVGTWSTSNVDRPMPAGAPIVANDITLHQTVHVSLGGSMVRIEFSNEFGAEPLKIGEAHIALGKGADIELATANALTFGGHPESSSRPAPSSSAIPQASSYPPSATSSSACSCPAVHQARHRPQLRLPDQLLRPRQRRRTEIASLGRHHQESRELVLPQSRRCPGPRRCRRHRSPRRQHHRWNRLHPGHQPALARPPRQASARRQSHRRPRRAQ